MEPVLILDKLDKSFGPMQALKEVSLAVNQGETLALAGENGAGKSTLMKILTGVYRKDHGEIFIKGVKVDISSAADAKRFGIAHVYQQAELVPESTVAENIFLGDAAMSQKGIVSWKKLFARTGELLAKYGIPIDPALPVKKLNIAMRQLVAVAKVLMQNPEIVIFDEPTAVLSDKEVAILFNIIAKLQAEKTTIIYISHRLEELFAIANRIAVMRDGVLVTVLDNKNLSKADLITHMLGRKVGAMYPPKQSLAGEEIVLQLERLTTNAVTDISFHLRKREILGITGLVGSGRTELARAIYGLDKIKSGTIRVDGKVMRRGNSQNAKNHGLFLAPEDRKGEALVLIRPIRENITLANLKRISRFWICSRAREKSITESLRHSLRIKTKDMENHVTTLSGGNQQKVVIAKAITAQPKILIFDEPTQGIDVGARSEIYLLLGELRKQGLSIIVISSEIEEVQGLCDRILVMRSGRLVGEVADDLDNTETILNLMYRSEVS